MATGVPRTSGRKGTLDAFPVSLSYPGKQPEGAILATAPGAFERVSGEDRDSRKRLYFGENLAALSALAQDPSVCGKVGWSISTRLSPRRPYFTRASWPMPTRMFSSAPSIWNSYGNG